MLRKATVYKTLTLVTVALMLSLTAAHTPVQAALPQDIIPEGRVTNWENAGIPGGIPDVAVVKNIKTDYGAKGDGIADDGPAFRNAIANMPTPGALFIPAGNYRITGELRIEKSGIVLRGEGADKTRLIFKLKDQYQAGIRVNAPCCDRNGIAVNSGFEKNSTQLTLANASSIQVGDFLDLTQDNVPGLMYTNPGWNQSWAQRVMGQIVRVTAKNGNTVTINEPLRLPSFNSKYKPRVRRATMILNFGVEDLFMTLQTHNNHITMRIRDCLRCWVRNIESSYTDRQHISLERSYESEIRGNYFHHSWDYGGDGHGYGVTLSDRTGNTLVEDNIFYHLRHAMMVKAGATGNVFGYNFATGSVESSSGQLFPTADISLHGHYPNFNLFEGNIVDDIRSADYWGPSGPGNTFFRNVARIERHTYGIQLLDASHGQNVVGNLIANRLYQHGSVKNATKHGNRIDGTVKWNPNIASQNVPASLYRTDITTPIVGYDLPDTSSNPAYERYLNSFDKTLLVNGSFEVPGGKGNKRAINWGISGKGAANSVRSCADGVAYGGNCAFVFKGGSGFNVLLKQTFFIPHEGTGTGLTLTARVKADNWQGIGQVRAVVKYLNGQQVVLNVPVTKGTYGYTEISENINVNSIIKTITLEVRAKNGTNAQTLTVDSVKLVMNGSGPLNRIALPAAPDAPAGESSNGLRR